MLRCSVGEKVAAGTKRRPVVATRPGIMKPNSRYQNVLRGITRESQRKQKWKQNKPGGTAHSQNIGRPS